MQDAVDRDRRLDQRMMEQLTSLVEGVSETMAGDLDKRVQNQWMVFEKKQTEKIVEPDDKEADQVGGAKGC